MRRPWAQEGRASRARTCCKRPDWESPVKFTIERYVCGIGRRRVGGGENARALVRARRRRQQRNNQKSSCICSRAKRGLSSVFGVPQVTPVPSAGNVLWIPLIASLLNRL